MVNVVNMWTDKSEAIIESVEVEVTRKIKVGATYKINPTEAWLGIDSGNIKVLGIIPASPDNETDYVEGIPTDMILGDIEGFKDDMLGGLEGKYYADTLSELDSQPWVVYHYPHSKQEEVYTYVLPLNLFVDHTTYY